jgi:hypothetical protein
MRAHGRHLTALAERAVQDLVSCFASSQARHSADDSKKIGSTTRG